ACSHVWKFTVGEFKSAPEKWILKDLDGDVPLVPMFNSWVGAQRTARLTCSLKNSRGKC
uniref:Uncharacterized protein n=1 Tax=Nothoprocta perdicaria TaxID=30464 RepID=A0A8C6ZUW3_NOTPE